MKIGLVLTVLVALLSSCATIGSRAIELPAHLLIHIGQEGNVRSLVWQDNQLVFRQVPGKVPGDKVTEKIYQPSSAQWRIFKEVLDKQNIWSWRSASEPSALPIKTGMQTRWQVAIQYFSQQVDASGEDAFPPDEKLIWQSAGYKMLCDAIKDLIIDDFC